MTRFPNEAHLLFWAGFCPQSDESAGKRRSNRMRKGAPWLKTTLIQCAWAAARKNGKLFLGTVPTVALPRGAKKAIGAVATSILTALPHA